MVKLGQVKSIEAQKSVGVIGSRTLSYTQSMRVGEIVQDLLGRQYHIATGGAIGADQFAIERLLRLGMSERCTVYTAWQNYGSFPVKVRAMMRQFKDQGGHMLWGPVSSTHSAHVIKAGLLFRNQLLVNACYGIVAFIDGNSRGSLFTIKKAAAKRLTMVVFTHDCHLPDIDYVKWIPLKCGGCWDGGFKAVYLR